MNPASPSCRLEGRPTAEHAERLRIECGTVIREIQGSRFSDPGIESWRRQMEPFQGRNQLRSKWQSAISRAVRWHSRSRGTGRLHGAIRTGIGDATEELNEEPESIWRDTERRSSVRSRSRLGHGLSVGLDCRTEGLSPERYCVG
jgi:hypothetical protein